MLCLKIVFKIIFHISLLNGYLCQDYGIHLTFFVLSDYLQNDRGMYKMYDIDESMPVPKRTKIRHQSGTGANNQSEAVTKHIEPVHKQCERIVDATIDMPLGACASPEMDECSKNGDSSQEKCLAVLSYISKMRLTGSASEQLIRLLNIFGNAEIQSLNFKDNLNEINTKTYDYCEICSCLFPEDKDIFRCISPSCSGLRYSGPVDAQHLKRLKSYFAASDVSSQILDVLSRNTVVRKGTFTLTMNTDGVPLYNSSSVSLWPVFLVINELQPSERFLMQNVIVWGIWQGRGKPVFRSFLKPLTTELNSLYYDGVIVGEDKVKIKLTCVTMDLQAKCQVMEMVPHNGQYSCVTCETPGLVTKKGKGHTKCFPVADPCPSRSSPSVLKNAEDAIQCSSGHVKGIKNVSVLFDIDHFDPVDGVVPDYMHGVLLGTTKKLLSLWTSRQSAGQPYYIGDKLKEIDNRLAKMKPTDNFSRIPRSIEHHLPHWKASEFQHWLLFYSIPCLHGILPPPFLDNLCYLVDGVYMLLGEILSNQDINNAELNLAKFQISFENLYGVSNCGLNVHNIGCHVAHYARLHGPLWGWSCFAFEDMNGILLRSAHGTGNVSRQLLQTLLVEKKLHSEANAIQNEKLKAFTLDMLSTGKRTKTCQECNDCKLLGKMHEIKDEQLGIQVLRITGEDFCSLHKVMRIKVNGQLITSKQYTRMQKRSVEFFVFDMISDKCFAYVEDLNVTGFVSENVSHLICVQNSRMHSLVPVDEITEKVLYLDGNGDLCSVARLPTFFNHCV